MLASDLFPFVVTKCYFFVFSDDEEPELDKWGIVEPIGPDLFRMLVDTSDGLIRGLHEVSLVPLGLSVEEGKLKGVENLRAMVNGGKDIHRQLVMWDNGLGHIAWYGHWLTASCIVLPELHAWASQQLKTDEILVSVPQRQFMFLFSLGDADFRRDMRAYIRNVVEGMEKRITFDLFLLTQRGLEPFTEPSEA